WRSLERTSIAMSCITRSTANGKMISGVLTSLMIPNRVARTSSSLSLHANSCHSCRTCAVCAVCAVQYVPVQVVLVVNVSWRHEAGDALEHQLQHAHGVVPQV